MLAPKERITNSSLLDIQSLGDKTDDIYDLTTTISANRPLHNREEAGIAAHQLSNVLSFVEYGVRGKLTNPERANVEPVLEGIGEIIQACRLVSLRVEQYIDLQEGK